MMQSRPCAQQWRFRSPSRLPLRPIFVSSKLDREVDRACPLICVKDVGGNPLHNPSGPDREAQTGLIGKGLVLQAGQNNGKMTCMRNANKTMYKKSKDWPVEPGRSDLDWPCELQ